MSLPQSHRMLPLGLQLLYLHIKAHMNQNLHIKAHMNQTLWGTEAAHQWIVRVWFLYLYHHVQSSSQSAYYPMETHDRFSIINCKPMEWLLPHLFTPSPLPLHWHEHSLFSPSHAYSASRMVMGLVLNCYMLWEKQKSSPLVKKTRKMADKVGFCTSNFIFSVLHHPHSWVCLVYWICITVSSIYLVICHCILLIIQVLIFVTNSESACADGLCLVYFIHLINICFILL
jgi:hypothetical protein